MTGVSILPTGTANLASVIAAFKRRNDEVFLVSDPSETIEADYLVLPGVGSFSSIMKYLADRNLDMAIKKRIILNRPTLAICLGFQIMGSYSDESPGVSGLNLFDSSASKFKSNVKVPQLGWNEVNPSERCRYLTKGHAYFANSYKFTQPPTGWEAAWSNHGEPFISAIEKGSILACQFHPELSGDWGASIIDRWILNGREN